MFERLVPVRWRDTDAQGHVNHAVFLTYLEEARDAFYAQVIGADPSYVVARVEVDLRAEVRHPDRHVTVRIQAERLGTTSLTTRETILTSVGGRGGRGARGHGPLGPRPAPAHPVQRSRTRAAGGGRGGYDSVAVPVAVARTSRGKGRLGLRTRHGVLVVQPRGELGDLVRVHEHGERIVLRLEAGRLLGGVRLMPVPSPEDDQFVEPSKATMPSRIPPLVWLI